MRFLKKTLIVLILIGLALSVFYFFWLSPRYVVPILMYHRFGYEGGSLFVSPENFAKQMAYLENKGYDVISLDELVQGIKNGKSFKHNTVVITIDDGYEDNYTYAYPVLKKHNFPATIFIIANFMDKKEKFMSWQQIKTMSENNISFGGHTRNEVYLPLVKDEEVLWDETAGCKKLIGKKAGIPADYFCYPTGGFTKEVKTIVREAGYKGACTTNRGFAELNKDVYELKRVKVKNSDMNKPFSFWAKLSGYYNLFRGKKSGHKPG